MKNVFTFVLVLLALNSYGGNKSELSGYRSPFAPDYIIGQFAGNIGFVSAGFGYQSNSGKLSSSLFVGYVPASIANATIITISQKNTLRGKNFKHPKLNHFYPSLGFSINIETGRNSFITLPERYPDNYYSTNAIKVGLFTGLTYQGKVRSNSRFHQFEYYAEIGTLASYVYYNIKRQEYLNPDILSLALGVRINLQ